MPPPHITQQAVGRLFLKRMVLSFGFMAVAMTITSLITDHTLPPLLEVVTFLVLSFALFGVMALVQAGRGKAEE